MMAREKFSPSQWKRAFAKYSKLGYPSDDDSDENEDFGDQLELPNMKGKQSYGRHSASDGKPTNESKDQQQSNFSERRLI